MNKANSIILLTDSAAALSSFHTDSFPHIKVKPSEVIWNEMQTLEPSNSEGRVLFYQNAEINSKTSGLIDTPRYSWADTMADISVDYDAIFVFAPHEDIFLQQISEIVNARVLQKTSYTDFFKTQNRQTGKLKSFVIKTNDWFDGISLVAWQCDQLLKKMASGKELPLSHIKQYFEQLSERTQSCAIMQCNQLSPWVRNQIIDKSLISKLRGNVARTKWITLGLGRRQPKVSERETLESQVDDQINRIMTIISEHRLTFSRIIISCSKAQLEFLKQQTAFIKLDAMQDEYKFKWLNQPLSVSAQILTGKDAIHISYSSK